MAVYTCTIEWNWADFSALTLVAVSFVLGSHNLGLPFHNPHTNNDLCSHCSSRVMMLQKECILAHYGWLGHRRSHVFSLLDVSSFCTCMQKVPLPARMCSEVRNTISHVCNIASAMDLLRFSLLPLSSHSQLWSVSFDHYSFVLIPFVCICIAPTTTTPSCTHTHTHTQHTSGASWMQDADDPRWTVCQRSRKTT